MLSVRPFSSRKIPMLVIFFLFLAPIFARAAIYALSNEPRSWRDADWSSTGILPPAADFTPARAAVYFSPSGGVTDAVVQEINAATQQLLVQAYSFTSAPIAKALVDAHKRGIRSCTRSLRLIPQPDKPGTMPSGSVTKRLLGIPVQST